MDNGNDARKDTTNAIFERIRRAVAEYYERSGLMQKALSKRTGIPRCQLCRILKGNRTIHAEELIVLMVELSIPPQEVFGQELWREYERRMKGFK